MENLMVWIWLAVTVIAVLIELATPQLISIWFAAAGVVGIIFSFIPGLPWWGEVIIFAAVAIVLIFTLRPFIKKRLKSSKLKTNIDRIVGQKVRMLSQADFDNLGEAKLGDVVWSVKPEDENTVLHVNEIVEIVEVEGNKLIVKLCD
ncbi:MAG: NfeD family protein [Clostridia bacterium]|nr:NfeD family protein [Clostridia bacterium]